MRKHPNAVIRARSVIATLLCLTLLSLAGCGGGTSDDASSGDATDGPAADDSNADAAPPPSDQVFKYKLDEVSPLGDYLPPLDGGKIELAPPEGWRVGSRQSNFVVWFHEFKDPKLLPQLRVKAEDAPPDAPQDATVANAKEYAQWVEKWLEPQLGDETLVEPVVPLVLGDNAFGRYVRAGKYKSSDADRMTLVTTKDGRVYVMEAIVFKDGLKSSRKAVLDGYAVGASLKKSEGGGVGGFKPPGE